MIEHRLLDEIAKRGYTIKEFCSKCGIDSSVIYTYIKGKKKKSMRRCTLAIIAKNLDISYEEIKEICPPIIDSEAKC